MPRYDMRCNNCGHFVEDIVMSYDEMKLYTCVECSSQMEYVPGEVTINTSASATFVRVPPERKAEISFMREQLKQKRAAEKERRNANNAKRGGA
jgi:DNA-directed RNA polymerase subunit RPC12/RpoP